MRPDEIPDFLKPKPRKRTRSYKKFPGGRAAAITPFDEWMIVQGYSSRRFQQITGVHWTTVARLRRGGNVSRSTSRSILPLFPDCDLPIRGQQRIFNPPREIDPSRIEAPKCRRRTRAEKAAAKFRLQPKPQQT